MEDEGNQILCVVDSHLFYKKLMFYMF